MDDATKKRIDELRRRHVAAVEGGTEGRIELMRQQHVEHARSEAALRARGVKLHVIRDENSTNLCPFYSRSVYLITCLIQSSNHTAPVCFGCPYPLEWAAKGSKLHEYDQRITPKEWEPYKMVRYVDGHQQLVEHEPWKYLRVEELNGDVWWFKLFLHGQVEPNYPAHQDHSRDTRWWALGAEDMATPCSTLSKDEVEQKKDSAEKKRFSLARPPSAKKAKKGEKGKKKRSTSDDE